MTLAYWCVLVAILLPYLSSVTAKAAGGGLSPKHNHDPRALLESLTGLARRAHNAQLNGFEVTPAFSAAVIIAQVVGVAGQDVIDQIAVAFVVSRLLYWLCYLADWAALRSLVWTIGMVLIVSLFVLSA